MFPVFSIISHSCLPNANPVLLQKNQLALEAKLDIAKGEEITISYISIMQASTTYVCTHLRNWSILIKLNAHRSSINIFPSMQIMNM